MFPRLIISRLFSRWTFTGAPTGTPRVASVQCLFAVQWVLQLGSQSKFPLSIYKTHLLLLHFRFAFSISTLMSYRSVLRLLLSVAKFSTTRLICDWTRAIQNDDDERSHPARPLPLPNGIWCTASFGLPTIGCPRRWCEIIDSFHVRNCWARAKNVAPLLAPNLRNYSRITNSSAIVCRAATKQSINPSAPHIHTYEMMTRQRQDCWANIKFRLWTLKRLYLAWEDAIMWRT